MTYKISSLRLVNYRDAYYTDRKNKYFLQVVINRALTHTHPHSPTPSQKKGHTHPHPLIQPKKGHTHPHPTKKRSHSAKERSHSPTPSQKRSHPPTPN